MSILPSRIRSSVHIPALPSFRSTGHESERDFEEEGHALSNRFNLKGFDSLIIGAAGGAAAYALLPAKAVASAGKTPWALRTTAVGSSILGIGNTVWQFFNRGKQADYALKNQISDLVKQALPVPDEALKKQVSNLSRQIGTYEFGGWQADQIKEMEAFGRRIATLEAVTSVTHPDYTGLISATDDVKDNFKKLTGILHKFFANGNRAEALSVMQRQLPSKGKGLSVGFGDLPTDT